MHVATTFQYTNRRYVNATCDGLLKDAFIASIRPYKVASPRMTLINTRDMAVAGVEYF